MRTTLLILAICFATAANATTFYVDHTASGANDGSSFVWVVDEDMAVRPATVEIGVLSGANHEFRLPLVVTRKVRLEGVTCGSYEQFAAMLRAIETSGLRPALDDRTFGLDELPEAFTCRFIWNILGDEVGHQASPGNQAGSLGYGHRPLKGGCQLQAFRSISLAIAQSRWIR